MGHYICVNSKPVVNINDRHKWDVAIVGQPRMVNPLAVKATEDVVPVVVTV